MKEYIATFYSHFGAMAFKKRCERAAFEAVIMPVPRTLSSSCGTCVRFSGELSQAITWDTDEIEQIVLCMEDGSFEKKWQPED